jgi:hypothetical protein
MNTHRFLSLVAATLITAGQTLIFATDTAGASAPALTESVARVTQPASGNA